MIEDGRIADRERQVLEKPQMEFGPPTVEARKLERDVTAAAKGVA